MFFPPVKPYQARRTWGKRPFRNRSLHDGRRLEASDVRLDVEVRVRGLAFGVEDVHRVGGADSDTERGRLEIEVDRALECLMLAAHVEREPVVDEDPQVIVAAEGELLLGLIR